MSMTIEKLNISEIEIFLNERNTEIDIRSSK